MFLAKYGYVINSINIPWVNFTITRFFYTVSPKPQT